MPLKIGISSKLRDYMFGEQKLVAIVHAMQTWWFYLEWVDYIVMIDHKSLIYLKTQHNLSRRQAQWPEILEYKFVYKWVYRPRWIHMVNPLCRIMLDMDV